VDAADDVAVDEGAGRRILQFQLDAAVLLQDLDLEIRVAFENAEGVVVLAAGVSTASAQRRSSAFRPPWLASRRRVTSLRESTSMPATGAMRALTVVFCMRIPVDCINR
jgi:hypothetical protein